MSILATKSGWIIAGKVVKETKTYYHFQPVDDKDRVMKVRKDNSGDYRIFEDVDLTLNWIDEVNDL